MGTTSFTFVFVFAEASLSVLVFGPGVPEVASPPESDSTEFPAGGPAEEPAPAMVTVELWRSPAAVVTEFRDPLSMTSSGLSCEFGKEALEGDGLVSGCMVEPN